METIYFAVVGGGMGIFGLVLLFRRLSLVATGTKTTGRFVDWEPRGRRVNYHPIAEFTASDSSTHRVTGLGGFRRKPKTVQQTYQVIYPENDPSKALIYSILHFWGGPIFFLLSGAGCLWLTFTR